jgi:hypothetical protein
MREERLRRRRRERSRCQALLSDNEALAATEETPAAAAAAAAAERSGVGGGAPECAAAAEGRGTSEAGNVDSVSRSLFDSLLSLVCVSGSNGVAGNGSGCGNGGGGSCCCSGGEEGCGEEGILHANTDRGKHAGLLHKDEHDTNRPE